MAPETINLQKVGEKVLVELQQVNKKIWDILSFSLIHAEISKENELKGVRQNVQEYRRERWQKTLTRSNGDKRKAYELLDSEDFY